MAPGAGIANALPAGETVFPNRTIPYCAPLAKGFKMIKGMYDTLADAAQREAFAARTSSQPKGGGERDLADARRKAAHCLVRERGLAFACLSGAAGRPFDLTVGRSTRRQRCGKEIFMRVLHKIWRTNLETHVPHMPRFAPLGESKLKSGGVLPIIERH